MSACLKKKNVFYFDDLSVLLKEKVSSPSGGGGGGGACCVNAAKVLLRTAVRRLMLPTERLFRRLQTSEPDRAAVNRRDGFIFEVVCFTSSPKTTFLLMICARECLKIES